MGGRPPADYRVDRPEVEAPRGAREPTGTNGPTLNTHFNHKRLTDTIECSSPLYGSQPTQTPTPNTRPTRARHTLGGIEVNMVDYLVVVIAAGKRPASIPNLEAKPASADGTAPGRVWESRTPPQHTYGGVLEQKVPRPHRISYTHNTHHPHASTTCSLSSLPAPATTSRRGPFN